MEWTVFLPNELAYLVDGDVLIFDQRFQVIVRDAQPSELIFTPVEQVQMIPLGVAKLSFRHGP